MTDTRPEEHRFPCDQCGADLRFNPEAGALVCDHCGHRAALDDTKEEPIRELDYLAALTPDAPDEDIEETRVLSCPNCGSEVILSGAHHAAECAFCATPVVIGTGKRRHIKPKAALPFALDEETARDAMTAWLGRLWFAPSGLKEYARKGRKMNGIYVPYWTYDANTDSTYRGERGTAYYETETYIKDGKTQRRTVRKIRWNPVSGEVARWFDDVLVLASKSLPKDYTDALAPWDLSYLEPYQPEYLAGFQAEAYQVDLSDGFREARAYMDRIILRDAKLDIGGDKQRVHHVHTRVDAVTFKHILLPVWLAAYKYRGKTYRFVVNGQSGRVRGERPWSAWKITFAILLGLIVAGALGYLWAQQ